MCSQDTQGMQVLTVSYEPGATGRTDHVLITVAADRAAGSVWRCDISAPAAEPQPYCAVPGTAAATIFRHTACGRLQLCGTADGVVRVQPLAQPHAPAPAGPYWQASLHDVQRGKVTGVAVSFDNAYLVTAAKDGTICLQARAGARVGQRLLAVATYSFYCDVLHS
jgi:hypothetical protein